MPFSAIHSYWRHFIFDNFTYDIHVGFHARSELFYFFYIFVLCFAWCRRSLGQPHYNFFSFLEMVWLCWFVSLISISFSSLFNHWRVWNIFSMWSQNMAFLPVWVPDCLRLSWGSGLLVLSLLLTGLFYFCLRFCTEPNTGFLDFIINICRYL